MKITDSKPKIKNQAQSTYFTQNKQLDPLKKF